MISQGTKEQAIELAKIRWAEIHDFDLEDVVWQELFNLYKTGEVLQAIRKSGAVVSVVPEVRYRFFERRLRQMAEARDLRTLFNSN